MNEQRQQAYLNLIQRLLSSPSGEKPQILQANQELLDADFLQMVNAVAQRLSQQGNEDAANGLRSLAVQLGEALGLSSPTVANPSEQELQAHGQFLMQVLQATAESEGDARGIYPLLAENTAYLNLTLAELLRHWATTTLPERPPDVAQSIAADIFNFSNLIQDFPLGNKASNMEIAIAGYEGVLTLFTRDALPQDWATTQNNLGTAYSDRIVGDKAQNIEQALACYQDALKVYTFDAFPYEWATTQNNLANAYSNRILGERAKNLEQALACYQDALKVYTYDAFPYEWARAQNNLANAYSNRILGERAKNLEQALACYQDALKVYTYDAFPYDWAGTQNNLGEAYRNRIRGKRAENLERALACYQQSLKVYTFDAFPVDWARTQNNLGVAYSDRITGEWAENLEQALAYYQDALKVYTYDAFPVDWARTQNNLGNAYSNRIRGERAENLERALACYQDALKVYTYDAFPVDWARTQNNLGEAYSDRITGEWAENLEQALAYYQDALKVRTYDAFPYDWARTQNNLGVAYHNRITGERAENLEQAIAYYQDALKVYTYDAFPVDWARTQNNLGNAYSNRIRGERAENLEQALAYYQDALKVYTYDAFPVDWARTQNNLGQAYSDRITGKRAENLEQALACYQDALEVRTYDAFPYDWARTQNNLGEAYSDRILGERAENLEQAIACYQDALKVYSFDAFPYEWAGTQNNLGNAYSNRIRGERAENLEQAIAYYQDALKVRTFDAFPVAWAGTQNNLGNAYSNRIRGERAENLEQAIAYYQDALKVRTFDAFPVAWATTQNNLGGAYRNRIRGEWAENLEQAIAYNQQSLKVYTFDAFPYDWAGTQNDLGVAYTHRITGERAENLEQALAYYQDALKVRTFGAFPQNHAETLFNLGTVYQQVKQFDLAYTTFKDAIATVESLRSEIVSGEESKRKQAEYFNQVYSRMVEVCLELDNITEAIEYAERSKTRNLVELILDHDLKTIFPSEVVTQLEQLRDEIASGQYQLQNGKAENPTALAQHLQQLRQQRNDLQNSHLPIGYGFKLDQFQATLDEHTTVVEWYITGSGFETFIITCDSLQRLEVSNAAKQEDAVVDWVNEYRKAYYQTKDEWENSLASRLSRLAEILHLEDILALVPKTCSRLVLIPHRYLHLLPLHTLPLANGNFLCDIFSGGVSYSPSCQLLQQVQLRKHPDFQSLFAIQNPTEDLYREYEHDLGAVGAIKKQFTDAYILKKSNATKSAILPLQETNQTVTPHEKLFGANCIFFFCHGYFDLKSPLDSGLQLADGNLTLADIIAHFDLKNCRLVTLSACETGLTDITNFSDEYLSLPYGFLLAGSTNVVSSLWTVSATATALLMMKFYEELQQQSQIAVALNTAQSWLRNTTVQGFQDWLRRSQLDRVWQRQLRNHFNEISREQGATAKPFEQPYYWAAFCAIGKGE